MGVPYAEVIGDPIAHSKSPLIHRFWLERLGLDYDFRRERVTVGELGQFLDRRRRDPDWCGCSVTLPNKREVVDCLDEVTPDARVIGAVNCVTRRGSSEPRLVGSNTDWQGFLEPLQPWLSLRRTYQVAQVIGAGGAASAISYALHRSGFTIVTIAEDPAKALELRRRLEVLDDDLIVSLSDLLQGGAKVDHERFDRIDLLVNATPLGMEGFPPLPLNLEGLPPDVVVYDIVYHPLETELLRAARARGLPVIDGLAMLIGQAACAFQLFFEEEAPREHDAELRELLTS